MHRGRGVTFFVAQTMSGFVVVKNFEGSLPSTCGIFGFTFGSLCNI